MFDTVETEKHILLINENSTSVSPLNNLLQSNYKCDVADSSEAALAMVRRKDYSVILSNINSLSNFDLELISQIQEVSPLSLMIVLSEKSSTEFVVKAFRTGVFDLLQMPVEFGKIKETIARAVERYESKSLKNNYQFHLEQLASERATEIDKALEEIEDSYRVTLKALVQALETRDFETHGHSERVVTFSLRLAREIGLDKDTLRDLELGALLHDIGKIGVPDAILRKPAKLSEEEWEKMKLHPLQGEKILRNIRFLEGASRVVSQHHEKWDGTGYPSKLRGEEIDITARIFAVADAFDAMISNRVYRKGLPFKEALEEIERYAGTQFDPMVVEAFKRVPVEDWSVLRERSLKDKQEALSFRAVVDELVHSRQQFELVH